MKKPTVDVPNAGVVPRGDYAAILKKIIEEGHCPFCREYLFRHHTKPILREGAHWLVTENFKPYDGVTYQFLIIALSHVERIGELPSGAGDEIIDHHRWLAETYNFSGSTLLWREGDTDMTGASVRHLHFQVIVGIKRGENAAALTALVGFKPGA
jgi:hypothetical protein